MPEPASPAQNLLAGVIVRQPAVYAINLLLILFVAMTLVQAVSVPYLGGWVSVMVALQSLRLVLWLRLRRVPAQRLNRPAALGLIALALLLGGGWGAFGVLFYNLDMVPNQVFVPFVLAGTSASAVASFAGHWPSTLAFVGATLLPYALMLALQDDPVSKAMAVIGLLYMFGLAMLARYNEMVLMRLAALSSQNSVLVADLKHARERLEQRVLERTAQLEQANIAMRREVEERRRSEAQVRHLLMHDVLTNLPNRLLLFDRLEQALKNARRGGQQIGVMMLDLDRFKEVNDTHGHFAGDELLLGIAERLRAALRAGDTVSRLGGDEFAIVAPNLAGEADALAVAAKLIAACRRPLQVAGREMRPSASIGIALSPLHGEDPEGLLRNADAALYRAKAEARGGYRLFASQAAGQSRFEDQLQDALARGELRLLYQPRVSFKDAGRVVAAEALVRWHHPERGLLTPEAFLPVAEASGLIREIGAWVLRAACAETARWREGGLDLKIAVNLSGQELRDPDLVGRVVKALSATGLAPSDLELEIPEDVYLVPGAEAADLGLQRLTDLGVGLAVDDVGTGSSSLARLARLPLQALKIDRGFVRGVADGPDAVVLAAAVALAHALGARAVAEGVESSSQLAVLRRLGCDEGQGFLFARPMAAEALDAFARGN